MLHPERDFEQELLSASWPALRLARSLGCSPDEAEDAVQEAAILAWRYRHTLRGEFKPWFLAIVRRTASRRRRWLTVPDLWHRAEPRDEPWPPDAGNPHLAAAIRALNGRQRLALWLRYGEDMSTSSVAQVLGVGENAAKQLISRGRDTVRKRMEALEEAEVGR